MAADAQEIVERIMTEHWDLAACGCWICVEGRQAGCRPRQAYLTGGAEQRRRADVEQAFRAQQQAHGQA